MQPELSKIKTPLNTESRKKLFIDSKLNTAETGYLYNMRDLNYFLKNIEKDQFSSFTSMPATPTSNLLTSQKIRPENTKEQLLNQTSPQIAQILQTFIPSYDLKLKRKPKKFLTEWGSQKHSLNNESSLAPITESDSSFLSSEVEQSQIFNTKPKKKH